MDKDILTEEEILDVVNEYAEGNCGEWTHVADSERAIAQARIDKLRKLGRLKEGNLRHTGRRDRGR